MVKDIKNNVEITLNISRCIVSPICAKSEKAIRAQKSVGRAIDAPIDENVEPQPTNFVIGNPKLLKDIDKREQQEMRLIIPMKLTPLQTPKRHSETGRLFVAMQSAAFGYRCASSLSALALLSQIDCFFT